MKRGLSDSSSAMRKSNTQAMRRTGWILSGIVCVSDRRRRRDAPRD